MRSTSALSAPPRENTAVSAVSYEEKLDRLFSYSDETPQFSDSEASAIVAALFQCRILDPACGSGAFPMGILQQMVHILTQLDPHNTQLKKLALQKASVAQTILSANRKTKHRQD